MIILPVSKLVFGTLLIISSINMICGYDLFEDSNTVECLVIISFFFVWLVILSVVMYVIKKLFRQDTANKMKAMIYYKQCTTKEDGSKRFTYTIELPSDKSYKITIPPNCAYSAFQCKSPNDSTNTLKLHSDKLVEIYHKSNK